MNTLHIVMWSVGVISVVGATALFFHSRFWKKIRAKVHRMLDKRHKSNLDLNRRKAQAYFERVVEPYFDSATRNEIRPTFEIMFEGFAMGIYRIAKVKQKEDRVRSYHFTHNGQTIYCKTSDREMTLPEFEKFIDGILKNHSVVPRN